TIRSRSPATLASRSRFRGECHGKSIWSAHVVRGARRRGRRGRGRLRGLQRRRLAGSGRERAVCGGAAGAGRSRACPLPVSVLLPVHVVPAVGLRLLPVLLHPAVVVPAPPRL